MFGGGASKDTSGDIEIRRNHFYKPRSWNPADPKVWEHPLLRQKSP
jgi:hypothetical protein